MNLVAIKLHLAENVQSNDIDGFEGYYRAQVRGT